MRPRFFYISLTQKSAKWLADRLRKRQGPLSFPRLQTDVDTQGKKHHAHPDLARNNLTKIHWFHLLPFFHNFMHFRHLSKVLFVFLSWYLFAVGLEPIFSFGYSFPKSFSSFSHGTCLPSVLNLYLASIPFIIRFT